MITRGMVNFLRELITDDVLHDIELALTEACSNVALHAYPGGSGPVWIRMTVSLNREISFQLVDQGVEFSCPLDLPGKDSHSGRGIYIIRRVASGFSYERKDGSNILCFKKTIRRDQWKECV